MKERYPLRTTAGVRQWFIRLFVKFVSTFEQERISPNRGRALTIAYTNDEPEFSRTTTTTVRLMRLGRQKALKPNQGPRLVSRPNVHIPHRHIGLPSLGKLRATRRRGGSGGADRGRTEGRSIMGGPCPLPRSSLWPLAASSPSSSTFLA